MKELRARQEALSGDLEEPLAALAHDCWKQCADELQAWLGEAESFVTGELCEAGSGYGYEDGYNDAMNGICQKLLGTMQEGK